MQLLLVQYLVCVAFMINRTHYALLYKFSFHYTHKHIRVKSTIKYNYQYICQKYQIDFYILSIADPIAVNDSIDSQITNQIENLIRFQQMWQKYKEAIEGEKLGRSSQDS